MYKQMRNASLQVGLFQLAMQRHDYLSIMINRARSCSVFVQVTQYNRWTHPLLVNCMGLTFLYRQISSYHQNCKM